MVNCARPGCLCLAISRCSGCEKEQYCSGECQKVDWKFHKSSCKILKKFSNKLQPYRDVVELVSNLLYEEEKPTKTLRFLTHLLSYAEFQFGDRVPGLDFRYRINGEASSNYGVEVEIMFHIHESFLEIYTQDISLSQIIRHNMMIPYLEKMSEVLRPWQIMLASGDTRQILTESNDTCLTDFQVNRILHFSTDTEHFLADIYRNKNEWDRCENHCKLSLYYARQFKGEVKTNLLAMAFTTYCEFKMNQFDYPNAVIWAEEAYNCVAEAHNPVHPLVQVC